MSSQGNVFGTDLELLSILSRPVLDEIHIRKASELIPYVDVNNFKVLVMHHRVWPCVYKNSVEHFPKLLPAPIFNYLKEKQQKNLWQSQVQFKCCSQLLSGFKKRGISIRVLKGIPLAFKLYGDIAQRHSNDLDFIVQERDLDAAHEVLSGVGFTCEQYQQVTDKQKAFYFRSHKDITYTSQAGVIIELHVRLTSFSTVLSERYLYALFHDGDAIDLKSYELLYLCWHGSLTLFHRLKWLVDIALYFELQNKRELSRLIEMAKETGTLRILSVSWVICNKLFGTSIVDEVYHFYESDRQSQVWVSRCITQLRKPKDNSSLRFKVDRFLCEFFLYQKKEEKIQAIMQRFQPTVIDFVTLPQLPNSLFFLYYPLRPLGLIYRRLIKTTIFRALKSKW
jgi:hypothetical protein